MKKLVLVVVAFAAISFATTSCEKTQKPAEAVDSTNVEVGDSLTNEVNDSTAEAGEVVDTTAQAE